MGWSPLGSASLTYNWQLLDRPMIGGELIRMTQSWTFKPRGKFLMAEVYAQPPYELYNIQHYYPNEDVRILTLPIPKQFEEKGIILRDIALKMTIYADNIDNSWRISIDEFF